MLQINIQPAVNNLVSNFERFSVIKTFCSTVSQKTFSKADFIELSDFFTQYPDWSGFLAWKCPCILETYQKSMKNCQHIVVINEIFIKNSYRY